MLSLPDLLHVRKTQREIDSPMVSRLVEADDDTRRPRVDGEHVALWPRELRTPALLVEVARSAADVAPGPPLIRP